MMRKVPNSLYLGHAPYMCSTVYMYMSCTRSRSVPIDDWYSYAVPEVDRLLVQLLPVPKVDRLLVQLLPVPKVDRLLVQHYVVPKVDRLLVQRSCTNRRLGQPFIYEGHVPKLDLYQKSIVKVTVNSVYCIKHVCFTN